MHSRPISVENSDDLNIQTVLPVIIKKQGFSTTLAFVITTSDTDRVDSSPITLRLWMNLWIAIDLARRSLKNSRLRSLGQPKHVDCAMYAGLGGLHRIKLVVDWRSWASKVENTFDLDVEWKGDIVSHQLEIWIADQVCDIGLAASVKIIYAKDVMPVADKTVAKLG